MSQTTDDISLPEHDAGVLFRAEMAAQNFVLGYWKGIVAAVVLFLVAVLMYGQYDSWYEGKQAAWGADVARLEFQARDTMIASAVDPSTLTDAQRAELATYAADLQAVAADASGPVSAEAWLKAAEVHRVLGDVPAMRTAFESAIPSSKGAVAFAAKAGLASTLLDVGETDAAIAAWQELGTTFDGFLGAWATLNQARVHGVLGQADAARAAYDDLMTRFADTELTAIAADERAALGAAAEQAVPEPAPQVVPEPAQPAVPEPVQPAVPVPEEAPVP